MDETEFESLANADEANFSCRLCVKIEVGILRVEATWAARVEEIKEELEVEKRLTGAAYYTISSSAKNITASPWRKKVKYFRRITSSVIPTPLVWLRNVARK